MLTAVRGGVCRSWDLVHFAPPTFCATESAPVHRWERTPGLPPWTCWGTLDDTTSQGGNQELPLLLLSLPLLWGKCGGMMFYRFLLGLAGLSGQRLPLPGGLAPIRRLVTEGSRTEDR